MSPMHTEEVVVGWMRLWSGLDPESGMRVVSSVTPWGSAAAIGATEAAYRAVDELEG